MTGRSELHGAKPYSNPPAEAAESVPGYRDLARIGHGGFSVVYRAVQESFERDVALKVLTVGTDEVARRRFLREVRLASKLSGHPHVVTVLDTGTAASGRPYLAMDLHEGGSMKERLRRTGPLSAVETAVVGAKIAEALAAAHALGVLHRDVKPNNILVSRFGEPALADFGVSCLLDSSSSASVLDVFSPQHAAPELMTRGTPSVSSDVYALGSTLYELLTGRPPFGSESRDVRSLMWRTLSEPAPRPASPDLPGLADAIVRAMAKEPEERFPDAAGFARTLRSLIPAGASATLAMVVLAPSARSAVAGASPGSAVAGMESDTGNSGESSQTGGLGPDETSAGRLFGADETMVRPDRADPASRPEPGSRDRSERERGRGSRRMWKPLSLAAAVVLLGAAVWAVIVSQSPSKGVSGGASARHLVAVTSASPTPSVSARPTPSATPRTRGGVAPVVAKTTASTGAASAPTQNSSDSLLELPGTYDRYQNAQSGECLASPSGTSGVQQSCAASQSEGWETPVQLTGILTGTAGQSELVNERSGDCLTADSDGGVSARACNGGPTQLWSEEFGPGSGVELRNADDGNCLTSSQNTVTVGSCSAGDKADLWSEDGTG